MQQSIAIPASTLHKMVKALERLENRNKLEVLISEDEAAALLGVTVKTLQNNSAKNKELYTKSPIGGKRFYFKDKILGL